MMPSDQAIVARIDSVLQETSRDPVHGSNEYAEDISEADFEADTRRRKPRRAGNLVP